VGVVNTPANDEDRRPILILLIPRLLNYVVAIYLLLVGVIGLNSIYHFIR